MPPNSSHRSPGGGASRLQSAETIVEFILQPQNAPPTDVKDYVCVDLGTILGDLHRARYRGGAFIGERRLSGHAMLDLSLGGSWSV